MHGVPVLSNFLIACSCLGMILFLGLEVLFLLISVQCLNLF